ncbi:MAG: threonine ammonia-lyase [Alphaproteobacteria bacterium]
MSVTIDHIRKARSVIAGAVEDTPFVLSRTLSAVLGAEIHLKFENLQFTASFKERGALNKLASLAPEEQKRGVVAMSAGNHAQGVAYHAQRLGIPAVIVMPRATPYVKVRQTAHFGARIVLEGDTLSEASAFAHIIAAREGLVFVHPYDDPHIIAGQGTLALEMLGAVPDLDILVVPIGGGGLISGMGIAAKALKPDIRVIGVEAELYPSMSAALRGEASRCGGTTIAEGIAVKDISETTVDIARRVVDSVITVTERDLERAINMLLTIEKTVAEGAGAAGLAAVMASPHDFRGRKVGIPLCGGNIDPRLLASVIMREMMHDGRIARIGVDVADSPGQLARVAGIVGEYGCSVIEVSHHRLALDMSAKHATLEMMIEARDKDQVRDIVARLRQDGFTVRGDPS